MQRNCTVQQAGSSAPGPKFAGSLDGGLDDPGILGKAEIIIRPDHDLPLAATDHMVSDALVNTPKIGIETLSPRGGGIIVIAALLKKVFSHEE